MTAKLDVSSFDLVNCFTSVLDLVSPSVMHHHKRVAYIAFQLATELSLPLAKVKRIFLASLLHDVGLLSLHERLNALQFEIDFEDTELSQHGYLGQFLIKDYFPFAEAAPLMDIIIYSGGTGTTTGLTTILCWEARLFIWPTGSMC